MGFVVPAITAAFASAGGWAAVISSLAQFAFTQIAGSVLGGRSFNTGNRNQSPRQELQGRTINQRGPINARQTVYGTSRVGGQIVFMETSGSNNKYLHIVLVHTSHEVEDLGDLYVNDEIVPLTETAAGFVPIADSKFDGKLLVRDYRKGTDDQTADTTLDDLPSWTSEHRLRGMAYTYFRLELSADNNVWPGGIPNFTRAVKGKKVYDPRPLTVTGFTTINPGVLIFDTAHNLTTGSYVSVSGIVGPTALNGNTYKVTYQSPTSVQLDGVDGDPMPEWDSGGIAYKTSYSANAALCTADYIASEQGYGQYGTTVSDFNQAQLVAAANICDEQVTLSDNLWVTAEYVTAGTIRNSDTAPVKAYVANISGTTGATAPVGTGSNIDDDVVTWNYVASALTTESRYEINGVAHADEKPVEVVRKLRRGFAGFVEYIGGEWVIYAGAWRAPTTTLTEADFAGPISGTTKNSRLGTANRVRGVFADNNDKYNVMEYPAVSNAGYLAEDGGIAVWKDLELSYTTSYATAQRLAKISLERGRQQITHTSTFNLKAMRIQVGDTFNLKFEKYGYGATGSHDGAADATVLTDTTKNWVDDILVGLRIVNNTDGSSGLITENTATTITATLANGDENDWDVSDAYTIAKTFVCTTHKLKSGDEGALVVEMAFKETAASVYDWSNGEETVLDPAPNSILPDPFTVATPAIGTPTSGTAELVVQGGTVRSRIRVPFTPGAEAHIVAHETQVKKRNAYAVTGVTLVTATPVTVTMASHNFENGDVVDFYGILGTTELNFLGTLNNSYTVASKTATTIDLSGTDGDDFTAWGGVGGWVETTWDAAVTIPMPSTVFWANDVEDGVGYDLRVRGVTSLAKSPWDRLNSYTVVGKTAAPVTPSGLAAVAGPENVTLTVTASAEVDFHHWEIFESTTNSFPGGAADYTTTDTIKTITQLTAATPYYFWYRAVDTTGNVSTETASVTATPDAPAAGADGLNNATVYLYQRKASTPSVPSNTTTYTFATGGLATPDNDWLSAIPAADGNDLWVTLALASANTATDSILTGDWDTPQILAEDGAEGTAGLNVSSVYIYQRSAATPASLPTITTTYTFATGALTAPGSGWTKDIPAADGNPLWTSVATASANTATDAIINTEWQAAVILSEDGSAGLNVAVVYAYQRAASAPSAPLNATTYTFATGVLSGTLGSSWVATIPAADGNPLWVITATASASTTTDSVAFGDWATGQKLSEDGSQGDPGLNTATVYAYQRNAATPNQPTVGNTTYTFSSGALAGTIGQGWTQAIPAADGNPLWVIQEVVSETTATATIAFGDWETARQMSEDGTDGVDGLNTATAYLYNKNTSSVTSPSTFTGTWTYTFSTSALSGGTLNGWTQTAPGIVAGEYLWVRQVVATDITDTDTGITSASFSAAAIVGVGGQDGVGVDATTHYLTKNVDSIEAAFDGTGYSFTGTGGTHKVIDGTTDVTTTAVHSIVGGVDNGTNWTKVQNGLTLTIQEGTGVYSLSGASWTSDSETFTLRATYNAVDYDFDYTIQKNKAAPRGTSGLVYYDSVIAGGTHTTAFHATILTDAVAWVVDEWIGGVVYNVTTGNSATITDNTATTITVASITGGFTTDDAYYIQPHDPDYTAAPTDFNFGTGVFTALDADWQENPVEVDITSTTAFNWQSGFTVSENPSTGGLDFTFDTPTRSINFGSNIQSDNFVGGSAGWQIQRDSGDAEFNNIVIRHTTSTDALRVDESGGTEFLEVRADSPIANANIALKIHDSNGSNTGGDTTITPQGIQVEYRTSGETIKINGRYITFDGGATINGAVGYVGVSDDFRVGEELFIGSATALDAGFWRENTNIISTLAGDSLHVSNFLRLDAKLFDENNAHTTGDYLKATATGVEWASIGGGGSVTEVITGTGLTGGPITTTGTIDLTNTGVTLGSYTNADITVDAQGRISAAANGSGAGVTGSGTFTPTTIPLWTAGTVLGDSALTQALGTANTLTFSASGTDSTSIVIENTSNGANDSARLVFETLLAAVPFDADISVDPSNQTLNLRNITGVIAMASDFANHLWRSSGGGTQFAKLTSVGMKIGGTGDPATYKLEVVGDAHFTGAFYDSVFSVGTAVKYLRSTVTGTAWTQMDADDVDDATSTNKFVTAGDITNLGNLSGSNSGDEPVASLTVSGTVELATIAETNTGTDATRAVTPDGLDGWTGSAQLTTLGTIGAGTWQGTAINQTYLVDQSGTNTGNVTFAGTGTYISLAGQIITVDPITESDISDLGAYITGITGEPLSDLSDVTITTIATGELLKWNGTIWINNTLAEAGISATGHSHNLTGHITSTGTATLLGSFSLAQLDTAMGTTGTASGSTYLRGDNSWQTIGGGTVGTGTPTTVNRITMFDTGAVNIKDSPLLVSGNNIFQSAAFTGSVLYKVENTNTAAADTAALQLISGTTVYSLTADSNGNYLLLNGPAAKSFITQFDTRTWQTQGGTTLGNWTSTGLRVGDSTGAAHELDVNGTGRFTGILTLDSTFKPGGAFWDSVTPGPGTIGQVLSSTGTGTEWIAAGGAGTVTGTGTNNYVPLWANGTGLLDTSDISQVGTDIGIGINSPVAIDGGAVTKLHVRAAVSAGYQEVARFQGGDDSNDAGATVRINTFNDNGMYLHGGRATSVNNPEGIIGVTSSLGAKSQAIYINSTAQVGMGFGFSSSNLPTVALDLRGKLRVNNGSHQITIADVNTGLDAWSMGTTTDNEGFAFYENASTERVTFEAGGNVGINETAPSYKLDVDGTGRFTGMLTADTVKTVASPAAFVTSALGYLATQGGVLQGSGSTYDVALRNENAAVALGIPNGTVNVNFLGSIDIVGTMEAGAGIITVGAGSGATAVTNADDFVLDMALGGGMSLLAANTSTTRITFGSLADNSGARIEHSYTGGSFIIGSTTIGQYLTLQADNAVNQLRLEGAGGSELATFYGDVTAASGTITGLAFVGVEGTAIESTGETGGALYLREDGDGTCSWQAVSGASGGTVTEVIAGAGFSFTTITGSGTVAVDGHLLDLDTLGAVSATVDQFMVSTGAGAWGYETPAQVRTTLNVADGATANAGTVTSVTGGTGLTTGPITGSGTINLLNTGVTLGSYTSADITVDAQGRITAASNGAGGGGTVTGTGTTNDVAMWTNGASGVLGDAPLSFSGNNATFVAAVTATLFSTSTTSSRDKLRVYNTSLYYNIGFQSGFTFGGLGTEFAMTFQMNTNASRGFWWGTDSHTQAQGAMALTTGGLLTTAGGARIGYGTSDVTAPSATGLDVAGSMTCDADGVYIGSDTRLYRGAANQLRTPDSLVVDAILTTKVSLNVDVPDLGGAPATTAIIELFGYEGRGAGIEIRDSVNSAAAPSNREWFVGSGYQQSSFNIGYASDGVSSSYAAQSKLTITTAGDATFAGDISGLTLNALAAVSAGDNSALGYTAVNGATLIGQGSSYDVVLYNDTTQRVLSIPTGTQNVEILGRVFVGGADGLAIAGTATTTIFHVEGANSSGFKEVARFEGGSDADNSGSITRFNHFNDRGMYIKAGRGTGDTPQVSLGITSSTGAMTQSAFFASNAKVGIGTGWTYLVQPEAELDVQGGINISDSLIDASLKTARITGKHYTNIQEPVTMIAMSANVATNIVYIGGFSSIENAATEIQFYTAANTTTVTGTRRMTINSVGDVGIGDSTPSYKLDVNGTGRYTGDLRVNAKVGIGMVPVEMLDIVSVAADCRIRLDAPLTYDAEIKFYNAGLVQYTIGHDDSTDKFVIGTDNVDTVLATVSKVGSLVLEGNATLKGGFLYMDGTSKEAIDANDGWLRLNQNGDFATGTYTPGNFRTDGTIVIGSSAATMGNSGTTITFSNDISVTGAAVAATFDATGGVAAGDNASIGYNSVNGLQLIGQGSANDVSIYNDLGQIALRVATGTRAVYMSGRLEVADDVYTDQQFVTDAVNGRGIRFWQDDNNYSINMSTFGDATYGGRLDTTSDYNMYFNMTGGTNRGFVFRNGTTPKAQIDGAGNIYSAGDVTLTAGKVGITDTGTVPSFSVYNSGNSAAITSFTAKAALQLLCYQSEGTPFTKTSAVIANSDGTVPSELQFWTKTNGDASPTLALTINSAQGTEFTPSSGTAMTIARIGGSPSIKAAGGDGYMMIESSGNMVGLNWYSSDDVNICNGGGQLFVDGADQASTSATGAIVVVGGIGVAKNVYAGGDVYGDTMRATAGLSAADPSAMGYHAVNGCQLLGTGSTNDVSLHNTGGGIALRVPTGTTDVVVAGDLTSANMSSANVANDIMLRNASGDTWARLFRSEYTPTNPTINYIMTQIATGAGAADNYIRSSTISQLRTSLYSQDLQMALTRDILLSLTSVIRSASGDPIVICAGESDSYATGQQAASPETIYLNAESGVEVHSHDGNWTGAGTYATAGWVGRTSIRLKDTHLEFGIAGVYDVNLYRNGATTLKTDDNFSVAGGTVFFGADCSLYRESANILTTLDILKAGATTESTSTTSGAFRLTGGAGIAKNVYVGGAITCTGGTLNLGVNDSVVGAINMYSTSSGSEGPQISMHVSNTLDGTGGTGNVDQWNIDIKDDDLRIFFDATGFVTMVGNTSRPSAHFQVEGTIDCYEEVTAFFSDERLKDIQGNIEDPIGKIKTLDGFYYTPNQLAQDLGYSDKPMVGLSAQQVQKIMPEVIRKAPVSDEYMTLDYAKLVPLLVEGIKAQQDQIDSQQDQIDELKKMVETLMNN